MAHRNRLNHALRAGLICTLATLGSAAYAGDKQASTVDDLTRAAEALGLQMLRPYLEIEAHRPYVMIVRDPRQLIPLGVDDVGRGDRVICRLLDGNRIVLYTNYGDRSAPIQLAPDGSIKDVVKVPVMEGNKHLSAQYRDWHEGRDRQQPRRLPKSGMSTRMR